MLRAVYEMSDDSDADDDDDNEIEWLRGGKGGGDEGGESGKEYEFEFIRVNKRRRNAIAEEIGGDTVICNKTGEFKRVEEWIYRKISNRNFFEKLVK